MKTPPKLKKSEAEPQATPVKEAKDVLPPFLNNKLIVTKKQPAFLSKKSLEELRSFYDSVRVKLNGPVQVASSPYSNMPESVASEFLGEVPTKKQTSLNPIKSEPHIEVNALAGTGKTFTIQNAIYRNISCPIAGVVGSDEQNEIWKALDQKLPASQLAYIAFNTKIKEEASKKLPDDVLCVTSHGFGKRLLAMNKVKGASSRHGVQKTKSFKILSDILGEPVDSLFNTFDAPFLYSVSQHVGFCKMNLTQFTDNFDSNCDLIRELSYSHGAILPAFKTETEEISFFSYVEQIYNLSSEQKYLTIIDFADMIWLPWKLDLHPKRIGCLYVDERQDLNKAQQDLILKAGERLVVVGDKHQAIYGFAGADANSCENLNRTLSSSYKGLEAFPLTYTRRCGKAIVEYNQRIVPEFKYHPSAPEGKITYREEDMFMNTLQPSDMIVCRRNAPLFGISLKLMKNKVKFKTTVKDFFQQTLNLIKSFKVDKIDHLIGRIQEWKEQRLETCKSDTQRELIVDQYRAVMAVCEECKTVDEVLKAIRQVFKLDADDENNQGAITVTSIHQSKGLEAPRVHWVHYDMKPSKKANAASMQQEINLKWVAGTRAIHELSLIPTPDVKENEFSDDE